jgi:hypothetical protein
LLTLSPDAQCRDVARGADHHEPGSLQGLVDLHAQKDAPDHEGGDGILVRD